MQFFTLVLLCIVLSCMLQESDALFGLGRKKKEKESEDAELERLERRARAASQANANTMGGAGGDGAAQATAMQQGMEAMYKTLQDPELLQNTLDAMKDPGMLRVE